MSLLRGAGGMAILGAAMIVACSSNDAALQAAALNRVEAYFSAFERGNADDYLSYYDPAVWQAMTRDEWLNRRKEWAVSLGTYKSHKPLIAQVQHPIVGAGKDTTVVLTYSVQYSRREAREIFTVRAATDPALVQIIDHSVRWDPNQPATD